MKKFLLFVVLVVSVSTMQAQIKIGGRTINTKKVADAATTTAKAVTLSDADIIQLCKESVDWMDKHNPIDKSAKYDGRLKRLTKDMKDVNGLPLNFKVYRVVDINAFACGDGSVRVFSSLMDIMNDDELVAVIGHEIGHVAHQDSKKGMKTAYMTSAAMKAASAAGGVVGSLSDSQLGELSEAFLNAQHSQKQEAAADEYGFEFAVSHGFDPYGMSNSMKKLDDLANGAKSSTIQKMFSSHPDSAKRAAKMKEKADKYVKSKK